MAFALEVSKALKNPGQVFTLTADMTLPDTDVLGDPVRFESVKAVVRYFGTGDDRVSLKGEVSARFASRCSRCLEPVQLSLEGVELDAIYAKDPDSDDPDLYGFEGHALDLEDAVRDAVMLDMPRQFLCKPDCRGLCPHCGANLNKVTCTCQEGLSGADAEASEPEADVTNPFSALRSIVLNDEEV